MGKLAATILKGAGRKVLRVGNVSLIVCSLASLLMCFLVRPAWSETQKHQHHHHHGMSGDIGGMVMNENKENLPRGCNKIVGDREILVRAGKELSAVGQMFTFDRNEWTVEPCSRLTVTLENLDDVRHQWMLHGLPRYLYPMGMFSIEIRGKGTRTGTLIIPAGNKTYLVHCDVPHHMEKGMKAQLKVGTGDGDIANIPGISGPSAGSPYGFVWGSFGTWFMFLCGAVLATITSMRFIIVSSR